MKQFSSAIFPLTIASILAGLTYALQWYVQVPETTSAEIVEHKPDAIVTNIDVFKIGPQGEIRYRLTSPRLIHFRDDDSTGHYGLGGLKHGYPETLRGNSQPSAKAGADWYQRLRTGRATTGAAAGPEDYAGNG